MAVTSEQLIYYLTGGSGNSDPNASLGGAISTTAITSGALNNIFDNVSGDEALAGSIEYRCIAIKNTNSTDTLSAAKAWISAQTIGADDISIAVETPSSGVIQTIVNETTAPTGVSFSAPADKANGIVCTSEGNSAGEIGAGEWVGIWIKRNVPAECASQGNNTSSIKVEGDTV